MSVVPCHSLSRSITPRTSTSRVLFPARPWRALVTVDAQPSNPNSVRLNTLPHPHAHTCSPCVARTLQCQGMHTLAPLSARVYVSPCIFNSSPTTPLKCTVVMHACLAPPCPALPRLALPAVLFATTHTRTHIPLHHIWGFVPFFPSALLLEPPPFSQNCLPHF